MASSTRRPTPFSRQSAASKGLRLWYTIDLMGSLEHGGTARFCFRNGEVFE